MTSVSLATEDVLELLPIGALVIDSEMRIVEWNRTLVEWTGIPQERAVGAILTTLFPHLADRRYQERLTQVFSSGFPATYSASLHRHFLPVPARHGLDCDLMIQQTNVRPLPQQLGLALITIQDVSFQYIQLDQLKKERSDLVRKQELIDLMNQQLVAQNGELDDFTRMVSHDLQQPLRTITSFGELLSENLTGELDEESALYLKYMMDAASRMRELIQDLLKLSRTARIGLESASIDLHHIVNDVVDLLKVAIQEKGVAIDIEDLPTVVGDRRLLTQLFQNLMSNAIKFSDEASPLVRVTAQRDGNHWVLGVQDSGIGIDAEQQQRVFEPFVRLHTRSDYPGTGLGLSVCKKCVTRHGGKLWVESTPGAGAHFKFTIPVNSPTQAPAAH